MTKCNLIAVFDAYRVQGHDTEMTDYHTSMLYLQKKLKPQTITQKVCTQTWQKDYVRVATSDGLEQIIIIGQGCHLVSAREFQQEVRDMEITSVKNISTELINVTI